MTAGNRDKKPVIIRTGATIGQLEPFDTNKPESWTSYLERFEFFLLANDVESENKKIATLVTIAGPDVYHILTSLAQTKKVSELSFKEIIDNLSAYFVPKKSAIIKFFEFSKRDQMPHENYSSYLVELQRLAKECAFENLLDKMLVRRFICGIRDEALQRRFLQEDEDKLTKKTVLDTATAAENAKIHQVHIKQREKDLVQKIGKLENNFISPLRLCYRCAQVHSGICRYKDHICQNCSKVGHVEKACCSYPAPERNTKNQEYNNNHKNRPKQIHQVNLVSDFSEKPEYANIWINGKKVHFEIDSGSPVTLISKNTFFKIFTGTKKPILTQTKAKIIDYQNSEIPVCGQFTTNFNYKNTIFKDMKVLVVNKNAKSILGRNIYKKLGITLMGAERAIHTTKNFRKKPPKNCDTVITPSSASFPSDQHLFDHMLDNYFSNLRPADFKCNFPNTVPIFAESQTVWTLIYSADGKKWIKGTIVRRLGYKTYLVALADGRRQRKNVKQLRRREPDDTQPLVPSRDRQIGSYTEDEAVDYLPLVGDGPSTSSGVNYKIRAPAGQSRLVIPTQSRSPTPSEDLEDDNIDSDEHTETDKTPNPLRSTRPRMKRSFFQITWD